MLGKETDEVAKDLETTRSLLNRWKREYAVRFIYSTNF